jgi:hypothetical protein
MTMNDEALKALCTISKVIDNLKYERSARTYTLYEDEMRNVFFCRDLADEVLRNQNKDMIRDG